MTVKLVGLEMRFVVGNGLRWGSSVRICKCLEIDVQN